MKTRMFVLLLGWLLIGCGHVADEDYKNKMFGYMDTYQIPGPVSALEVADQADVACSSPSECPEAVAQIVSTIDKVGSTDLGFCTASLVAPDIISTNGHCIPPSLRKDPSSCATHLAVKFPAQPGRPAEVISCQEILFATPFPESLKGPTVIRNPDIAFVRLSKAPTRKPFLMSRAGIEDGRELTLYSFDRQKSDAVLVKADQIVTRVKKRTCTARQHSNILPEFSHAIAPLVLMFGEMCDIIPGNSGSALLMDPQTMVGVLQATGFVALEKHVEDSSSRFLTRTSPTIQIIQFSGGSNFACFEGNEKISGLLPARSPMCEAPQINEIGEQAQKAVNQASAEKVVELFHSDSQMWRKELPQIFAYWIEVSIQAESNTSSSTFTLTPILHVKCVLPHEEWGDVQLLDNDPSHSRVEFVAKSFVYQVEADQYLRPQPRPRPMENRTVRSHFKFNLNSPDQWSGVEVYPNDEHPPLIQDLRWCSQDEITTEHDRRLRNGPIELR